MKLRIIEQTPKLLKLQLKPQAIFYWLFSAIFVAGGIFLMTVIGKATTFSCSRITPEPNSCQLTTKSLLDAQVQSWNLQEILGAKLDTSTTDTWGSYPFVLQTIHGSVFINLVNADSTQKEVKAGQINTFLKTPQEPKITISEDSRFWAYPLGLFMITGGAICIIYIITNKKITCIVDKIVGKITIERKSCFGDEVVEAKLSDIVGIELNSFEFENSTSYNVSLNLASGHTIYIAAGPMFTANSANKIIEDITSFINT